MRVNLKAQPSCWIINRIKSITGKKELQILDFASGSGRHSISLADPKRKITAVDNDSKKLSSYNNFQNIKNSIIKRDTVYLNRSNNLLKICLSGFIDLKYFFYLNKINKKIDRLNKNE